MHLLNKKDGRMKYNVNETRSTKITCVIKVLILTVYLNIVWEHKNRAGAIGAAGTAMAVLFFFSGKNGGHWNLLL